MNIVHFFVFSIITAFLFAVPSFASAADARTYLRTIEFETDEGTWMSVDVSPAGDSIVFDLLGDLYLLPVEGGQAVVLTAGTAWDQRPTFSRDGRFVYFLSDRVGYKNVWRVELSTRRVDQITQFEHDVVGDLNWEVSGNRLIIGAFDGPQLAKRIPFSRTI